MLNDLRFAARMFARRPGVAALIIVTLAVGIAASTAVFSIADAILWHPLPFRDPDRLVALASFDPARQSTSRTVRLSALKAWRAKDQILEDIYAYGMSAFLLTGEGDAEALTGGVVSNGMFAALGVRPHLGRDFRADDFRRDSEPVVVLGDALWRTRFAGATDIVGRSITIDDRHSTVIGVMPPGFEFPVDSVRLWVPDVDDPLRPMAGNAFARLRPGVPFAQARTTAEATTHHLLDPGGVVLPEIRVMPFVRRDAKTADALFALLGAVAMLLLIAVGNAANVLLAEAVRRDAEMAVRSSLGASFGRLVRQVVTETLLVTVVAAAVAATLASVVVRLVAAGLPRMLTYQSLRPMAIDWRAIAFAIGIATAAGLGTALAPLTRARRATAQSSLKGEAIAATSHGRLRSALVVLQLAVTIVLLVAAGLLANSFVRLNRAGPGFSTSNLITIAVQWPRTQFHDRPAMDRFLDEWKRRAAQLPGVAAATVSDSIPPGLGFSWGTIETADHGIITGSDALVAEGVIDDGFFATLGIPLLQGRTFDAHDTPDNPPAAVIGRAMAELLWPNGDAIGRRFRVGPSFPWYTVVGVVGNVRNGSFDSPRGEFAAYYARGQAKQTWFFETLIVRAAGTPGSLEHPLRELTRTLNPNLPVVAVETADELVAGANARVRFVTFLMWGFAAVATLLALVGVYGAFWCAVRQRTREIGVRLALGAAPLDIVRLVLTESARVVCVGLIIGLPIALGVGRGLRAMLFDVSPADPLTLGVVCTGLIVGALAASYLPARRAGRVDPTVALRHE
jgi:putative ABC transport system permease protein